MQIRKTACYVLNLFPFSKIAKGSRVAIWGNGKIGSEYYWQNYATKYCNIIAVADISWKTMQCGYDVIDPACLKTMVHDIDKIIVAISRRTDISVILDTLRNFGYQEQNIIIADEEEKLCIPVPDTEIDSAAHTEMNFKRNEAEEYEYIMGGAGTIEKWKKIHNYLKPFVAEGYPLVRIGNKYDGGYVMIDDFDVQGGKTAYSFGISSDVSWDQCIADMGYEIYMYDPTIFSLPYQHSKFHFRREGVTGKRDEKAGYKRLENCLEDNGHMMCRNMILKMDVEGAEWDVLSSVKGEILERFNQIVLELHALTNPQKADIIIRSLSKMNETHYPVHVHANNFGKTVSVEGEIFPDTVEITYARKSKYCKKGIGYIEQDKGLDAPCWPQIEEINWKL